MTTIGELRKEIIPELNNRYNINCIYPAFQGECNFAGIGASVIFVRFQGCHLRCYKDTLGTLCDTPEALEGKSGGKQYSLSELVTKIQIISELMGGVKLLCFTGGDPLWQKPETLFHLFRELTIREYHISVETSGTLSIRPYRLLPNVHFVLDYKLKSCGVKQKFILDEINLLDSDDYIKFVVYNEEDYAELKEVLPALQTKAKISAGVFWGGQIGTMELYNKLLKDGLLGKVSINAQLHKLAFFTDTMKNQIDKVIIPQEI